MKYDLQMRPSDLLACRYMEMPSLRTGTAATHAPPSFWLTVLCCSVPAGLFRAEGMLKNVNTIEEYRALDRSAIIEQAANTV